MQKSYQIRIFTKYSIYGDFKKHCIFRCYSKLFDIGKILLAISEKCISQKAACDRKYE